MQQIREILKIPDAKQVRGDVLVRVHCNFFSSQVATLEKAVEVLSAISRAAAAALPLPATATHSPTPPARSTAETLSQRAMTGAAQSPLHSFASVAAQQPHAASAHQGGSPFFSFTSTPSAPVSPPGQPFRPGLARSVSLPITLPQTKSAATTATTASGDSTSPRFLAPPGPQGPASGELFLFARMLSDLRSALRLRLNRGITAHTTPGPHQASALSASVCVSCCCSSSAHTAIAEPHGHSPAAHSHAALAHSLGLLERLRVDARPLSFPLQLRRHRGSSITPRFRGPSPAQSPTQPRLAHGALRRSSQPDNRFRQQF